MDLNGLTVAVLKESIQASSLANMISGFRIKTELIYAKSFDEPWCWSGKVKLMLLPVTASTAG
jgi:hypothetical protein